MENIPNFQKLFRRINPHEACIAVLKCQKNAKYYVSLIKLAVVIEKKAAKNIKAKKISTNKTDLLCSFQKSKFYHCQNYTMTKTALQYCHFSRYINHHLH